MASMNESRESERSDDGFVAIDDFATRLARVVFEWRPISSSSPRSSMPAPASERWMSENVRRSHPES